MRTMLNRWRSRWARAVPARSGNAQAASAENELTRILDNLQDTYYRTDVEGRVVRASAALKELLGYEPSEVVGTKIADLYVDPDGRAKFLAAIKAAGGAIKSYEAALRHKNGSTVWVSTHAGFVHDTKGKVIGVEGVTRDITQEKAANAQMRKLSGAVEQTADMVMITNRSGLVEYVNQAFCDITGFTCDEVAGQYPNVLKSGRQDETFYRDMWATILGGEVFNGVLVNKRKDGSLYYEEKTITPLKDADGRITHFIATGRDITERMETHERLRYLAYHDVLTQLPNRALLTDRLDHAAAHARRRGTKLALLFLDLDRFKVINDTLGHDFGDRLLQVLSERLQQCVREEDTVARLSGDEFAVLLENVTAVEAVAEVAHKLLDVFERPFEVFERELFITTSIGISVFPNDGDNGTTLLKHADTAMYRAKDLGRNSYQFYSADMSTAAFERLNLETSLRRALERKEFVLHYQPQVNFKSGRILGVEALLRWQHPERGLISCSDFIPLLEETGLIVPVGEWVIKTACREICGLSKAEKIPLRLAINLSPRQFHSVDLISHVTEASRVSGMDPEQVEFEITEGMLMSQATATLDTLSRLADLGYRLAIDDFGTGYSSLSYLKRFPINVLKVDRSFVRDIPGDRDDTAIVNTIIAMARSLDLEVTAEGVETHDQLASLRAFGCDTYQGFLFSHPLPLEELRGLLAIYSPERA
jgi:diguanylate cyclase (GGDEF)-like protein/PAS domain S-box-containing protein